MCLDSVPAVAEEIVNIPVDDLPNGVYWLYARDNSNNISDHKDFIISGVGIDIESKEGITVYPIPVRDMLKVESIMPGRYSIEITSLNGRSVYKGRMDGSFHQVNLTTFRKGLYFITIRSQDKVITRKIVKL